MKYIILLLACCITSVTGRAQKSTDSLNFYKLVVYHYSTPLQEKTVDNYLEKALLPALHDMHMKNIGVLKSMANDTAADKTIVLLLNAKSLQQLFTAEESLQENTAYKIAAAAFSDTTAGKRPFDRYETIILRAFPFAIDIHKPKLSSAAKDRVYELRSYESASDALYKNKVTMFNQGGEIALFARLNFNAVFYAEVLSGHRMPNLMYMTSFENMADRDAHWKTFSADAEWKKLSAMSVYQNNVSRIDITFLRATSYSDF